MKKQINLVISKLPGKRLSVAAARSLDKDVTGGMLKNKGRPGLFGQKQQMTLAAEDFRRQVSLIAQ